VRRDECQILRDLCPHWRQVTAVGLSDEHPSRERAADGGRELREIMQGQQRTERAMLGDPLRPPHVASNQPHPPLRDFADIRTDPLPLHQMN
jgi:hypothetical protein